MPILQPKKFSIPVYQYNKHLQTIVPSFFRKIEEIDFSRERIATPDGDFLDLDWSKTGAKKLIIITHGLEGNSTRHYVTGLANLFNKNGWDALAWNCRSCSGEPNLLPRFYHHGDVPDFKLVVEHALSIQKYDEIYLTGFSMGGSMVINYLGKEGKSVPKEVKKGIAVSVPCDLRACSDLLEENRNRFYNQRFLKKLKQKVYQKNERMPNDISIEPFKKGLVKTCRDFDQYYTAPLHGFADAFDFYENATANKYMQNTNRPILILNALNDPFLSNSSYPVKTAQNHDLIFLETPTRGGHVGFVQKNSTATYAELRTLEFCTNQP
ncbi:alpha/beta fold hydrolase [Flammeovirgaceae bacterium SG7u.111]|nr:alpha/beta fold hydrolase [Flammeovirgaceae bacterium SG7u.132]WPO36887.1 alpha/beta fold hydrolase [Flammeovirgaceae bacterium SG7u.111]